MPTQEGTDTLAIVLSLVRDIASKVDDLSRDHVTKADMVELRHYIDDRLDKQQDRHYSKDETNARFAPLEKTVDRLEQLSLSEMQRVVTFIGGVLGAISAVLVLLHYVH